MEVNYRYIKFAFLSDSSTQKAGWNIGIQQNPLTNPGPVPAVIGQRLYLDPTGYDKVIDTSGSGISIGRIAATDASNNAVYMRSLDFSVFDGSTGETGQTGAAGPTGPEGPKGADAIIMVEDTSGFSNNDQVKIMNSASSGAHIRKRGEEINEGDVLIKKVLELQQTS